MMAQNLAATGFVVVVATFEILSKNPSGFIRKKELSSYPSQLSRSDSQQSQAFFFFLLNYHWPLGNRVKNSGVGPATLLVAPPDPCLS